MVHVQGDDSVIDCVFNDQTGTVVIQASHDIGHSNEVLSDVSQSSFFRSTQPTAKWKLWTHEPTHNPI